MAERRNRGYTLYDARSGTPVARLRPAKRDGHFEVLYWSLWKERWSPTGPFGSTILALDDALACNADNSDTAPVDSDDLIFSLDSPALPSSGTYRAVLASIDGGQVWDLTRVGAVLGISYTAAR